MTVISLNLEDDYVTLMNHFIQEKLSYWLKTSYSTHIKWNLRENVNDCLL